MTMADQPTWRGRKLVSATHMPELERMAAVREFEAGLPREQAEEEAHREYSRRHHLEAAAHHLRGLRGAQGTGDLEEARKFGVAYGLHLNALGFDEFDQVPPEIQTLVDAPDKKPHARFKAHSSDRLLLGD